MKNNFDLQLFVERAPFNVAGDFEPAISIDHANRIASNIKELQEVLGITEMQAMNAGTTIKLWRMEQVNTPEQVGEGEEIGITRVERVPAGSVELVLKKYRRNTTAEAIQKVGRNMAINQSDEKLVSGIQKEIKKQFYDLLAEGRGSALAEATLQATLANAWGAIKKFYEDQDATPIYFVSSEDVAEYLGTAQVSMQTAFGMSYIKDFLGLGTVVVSPALEKGKLYATAKENLNGAYIPANSGDVANTFNLTADSTGLVGIAHYPVSGNATIDTLAMSGVVFYPEMIDGVIVATIGQPA